MTQDAFDLGVAARPAGEPVDLAEPQPGSLANLLGGEEGLEDVGELFGRDTAPGVGHRQAYEVAGEVAALQAADILGLDADEAAARHGVAGVHGQIQERQFELAGVRFHRP